MISKDAHIGSFIGFAPADSPEVAVLVVVHESQLRPDYGSVTAAPYARDILEDTLAYLGIYPETDAAGQKVESVEVPDVRGLTVGQAAQALREAGLDSLLEGAGDEVVDQLPQAGAQMNAGSQVLLYLEDAYEQDATDVEVPSVVRQIDSRGGAAAGLVRAQAQYRRQRIGRGAVAPGGRARAGGH